MVHRLAAGAVIGLALAQFAIGAESDPLASLPAQVAGVVGSGDQLTLQLKDGDGTRVLAIGAVYQAGWRVQSINPAVVTLVREGVSRQIGLNPSGALSARDEGGAPVILTLLSAEDLGLLQGELDSGAWDGLPKRGLTLDESRRLAVCNARYLMVVDTTPAPPQTAECERLTRLSMKAELNWLMANGPENERRVLQGLPPAGPASFYVAPGTSALAAAQAAGAGGLSGYTFGSPDASGGYVMTRSENPGPAIITRTADGSWDYVSSIQRAAGQTPR